MHRPKQQQPSVQLANYNTKPTPTPPPIKQNYYAPELVLPEEPHIYFSNMELATWLGKSKTYYQLLFRSPDPKINLTEKANQLDLQTGDLAELVFLEQENLYRVKLKLLETSTKTKDKLEYQFNVVQEPNVTMYNPRSDPPELCPGGCLLLDKGYLLKLPN